MISSWITQQLADEDMKPEVLANRLGIGRTQLVSVRDGKRGVGPKLEQCVARLLFNGDVTALRKAAKMGGKLPSSPPPSTRAFKHPNLGAAVQRLYGLVDQRVIDRAVEADGKAMADLREIDWVDQLLSWAQELERMPVKIPREQ